MKKRPDTVDVGRLVYNILYTKKDYDLGEDLGVILHEKCTIKVLRTCSESVIRNVLWHEVLHAIYYWYDIQDDDPEERTVCKVALGTYRVMLDNPELMEYLTG